jgi:flagellar hook-associated protein 2
MSGTSSIGGLVSGLDTNTIITQLMQVEAAPQNRLKTKLTSEQGVVTNLQSLNTKVAALATQAKALASASGWGALTATSSSTDVAVAATTGTAGGTFSFSVDQTAAAHRLTFAGTAAGSATVVSGGTTVNLTVNGVQKPLDTGNGSLDGLVSALNGAGTGVTASKVKLDDGTYRLVVTSSSTGAASAFTLTNADGTDLLGGATVSAGRDAAITIGADTIHSSTNTFKDAIPGVSLTVSNAAVGSTVDVTVAQDTSTVKGSVKSLVDAVNDVLSQIDSLTAYNSATKTSGPLESEVAVRQLRDTLLNAVYPGDGTTMATVGIQTDRDGKLVFDENAFNTAYAADPSSVRAKFVSGTVNGFAARVQKVSTDASDSYTGSITQAVTGHNSTISGLQDSIADWDTRLALKKDALTTQFTALETALSQLNSQSSWLSGQINSLSASSKSS